MSFYAPSGIVRILFESHPSVFSHTLTCRQNPGSLELQKFQPQGPPNTNQFLFQQRIWDHLWTLKANRYRIGEFEIQRLFILYY